MNWLWLVGPYLFVGVAWGAWHGEKHVHTKVGRCQCDGAPPWAWLLVLLLCGLFWPALVVGRVIRGRRTP